MGKGPRIQLTHGRRVTQSWTTVEIRRHSPGCTLYPTGRCRWNVASIALLEQLAARLGLSAERLRVELHVDEAARAVGVIPTAESAEGVQPVHRFRAGDGSVHLGGVFAEYPDLRPNTRRACDIVEGLDPAGNECLVILLGPSREKGTDRRRRRERFSSG